MSQNNNYQLFGIPLANGCVILSGKVSEQPSGEKKNSNKAILCKLVHKQWPTMYMLERNGMSTTDICPLCMNNIENWDHVFKCKSDDAIIEKNTQLNLLQKN